MPGSSILDTGLRISPEGVLLLKPDESLVPQVRTATEAQVEQDSPEDLTGNFKLPTQDPEHQSEPTKVTLNTPPAVEQDESHVQQKDFTMNKKTNTTLVPEVPATEAQVEQHSPEDLTGKFIVPTPDPEHESEARKVTLSTPSPVELHESHVQREDLTINKKTNTMDLTVPKASKIRVKVDVHQSFEGDNRNKSSWLSVKDDHQDREMDQDTIRDVGEVLMSLNPNVKNSQSEGDDGVSEPAQKKLRSEDEAAKPRAAKKSVTKKKTRKR